MKKTFSIIGLFLVTIAAINLQSCYADNEEELYPNQVACDTTRNVYNGRIKEIIATSCLPGCHEQAVGSAGIILEGFINLKNQVMDGQVMCSIRHEGCSPMPKNQPKLSDCDINNLQNWIDKGYPEN